MMGGYQEQNVFEYDNGILVCREHRTPVQKDDQELWCRKCVDEVDKWLVDDQKGRLFIDAIRLRSMDNEYYNKPRRQYNG